MNNTDQISLILPLCTPSTMIYVLTWAVTCFFTEPIRHQSQPQLGIVFALALSFHSFWTYFSTLLHSILDTYWPGSSSFSVISFCLFILFMGFSRQKYWSDLSFPPPGDHILSELSTMAHLFWVALCSMAHSCVELDKVVIHVISLVSFLWLWFSFCLPSDR